MNFSKSRRPWLVIGLVAGTVLGIFFSSDFESLDVNRNATLILAGRNLKLFTLVSIGAFLGVIFGVLAEFGVHKDWKGETLIWLAGAAFLVVSLLLSYLAEIDFIAVATEQY